jgi:hypothetical protein
VEYHLVQAGAMAAGNDRGKSPDLQSRMSALQNISVPNRSGLEAIIAVPAQLTCLHS